MKILVTGDQGFVGKHLCTMLMHKNHTVLGMDLKNGLDILTAELPDVDVVVHLAAKTDAFEKNAFYDAETNILGSIRLMQHYGKKLIFISSSMSKQKHAPYALSKKCGEYYAKYFGCPIIRFCNLYGEGGHSAWDRFRDEPTITIYGDGTQLRTYAPIEEALKLTLYAIEHGPTHPDGSTKIFELSGKDLTVSQIAAKFPGKPVTFAAPRDLDILDARQRQ